MDDDDELASLRAMRKEKLGDAGITRGEAARVARERFLAPEEDDLNELPEEFRAQLPMSFGKQQPSTANNAKVHEATKRINSTVARTSAATPAAELASNSQMGPPRPGRLQGSNDAPDIGPPRPARLQHSTDEPDIGPPRPARSAASNDGPEVGPPRPDRLKADSDACEMGPPRPGRLAASNDEPQVGPRRPDRLTDSNDEPQVGPPRPTRLAAMNDGPDIGPPRPSKLVETSEEAQVGPPRPPRLANSDGEPNIGPPRPKPLGEGSMDAQEQSTGPQPRVAPPPPPKFHDTSDDRVANNTQVDDSDPSADDPALPQLPVSNEVVLRGHHKIVSAMDVERSGARVVTGGMDYQVCLYDFNGMKADGRPFRELMPQEGHPVHAVTYSPSGDAFLVVTGEPRAKVYDRDGRERGEFKRGDMYLRDLKNTKGHVAGLTHGQWHPLDRHSAMTCSTDGTIRLWDCQKIEQKMVIKPTGASGRVPVTACCYSPDGNYIAGALTNGTIQVWTTTGNFGKSAALDVVNVPKAQMPLFGTQTWKYAGSAKHVAKNAHPPGTEISDIRMLKDAVSLLTRGADDTLKLWDIRLLKQAVHVWDVPASHTHTRMCVSPNEDLVLTGSVSQETGSGTVEAFRLKPPYDLTHRIGMPTHVTSVMWHPVLNQLLVGCGDRTTGSVHVLYSPERSEKGALLCAGKKNRLKSPLDFQPTPIIHTPGALPMFRDDSWRKRKRPPEGGAAMKRTQIPDPGPNVAGAGGGGKIGATSNTLLTQYLLEKGGMKKLDAQMDPREAILRHKDAEKDMAIYTKAYSKTQPEKKFAEPEDDQS